MKKNKEKIAIIGSGIFGCTLALVLSKKYDVSIFEIKNDILNEASKMNQFRFHLGFHYPRSQSTIKEIQKDYKDFLNFYGNKIYGNTQNYYAISKKGSKTNFKKYLKILKKNRLNYKIIKSSNLTTDNISGLIITNEKVLNYFKLKSNIKKLIKKNNIKVFFNKKFQRKDKNKFSKIYLATYKNNNIVLKNLDKKPLKKYRYELVEKLIVKLPEKYKKMSLVILDGKFLCIDPYLGTKFHLLSHVKLSKIKIIHSTFCNFPRSYKKILNQERSSRLKMSRFKKIIKDGSKYLPFLEKAKYISSFYLVRTLNINSIKNDDRTNQITKIDRKISTILSGKWNTAVSLSRKILNESKQ